MSAFSESKLAPEVARDVDLSVPLALRIPEGSIPQKGVGRGHVLFVRDNRSHINSGQAPKGGDEFTAFWRSCNDGSARRIGSSVLLGL